ncbi:hypothetical protein OG204_35510 (plasmid) [Streptomyces sp. NBC_01387]|uniref:hypothetical protein n=1 Tax=unclassified Streptomyces TaxID=2593676 RepID=UPI002024FAF2|nr:MULTISPECIES: hypothetical protein [unclassified Streptomyces]MCX4554437.1 hypothetical protein [Streptomyces sp. NBC_01500]WSC25185.1 hypothetical protein OIE60_36680 [Streptomyces sp. NBC_01766]WSV58939.1 hypothetical protein OG282_35160 [Streptomyces sp. NBC_01014]
MSLTTLAPAAPAVAAEFQLAALVEANRPAQMPLVTRIARALSPSPALTHLLVRGSLASGTADRLSDVDFVVGVKDAALPAFATGLNDLMTVAAGALLPGWPDSIVTDLGGLGFVFLIPYDGKLQQVDLYLAPASAIPVLRRQVTCVAVLDRAPVPPTDDEWRRAAAFVAERAARAKTCTELLIEHLVLAVLLHKRIQRGQRFVAYAEWHLMHTATKDLLKAALAPTSRFWGWYQLREEIALTPIGRACLADLDAAVASPAVPSAADVERALDRVFTLVERACPHAMDGLSDAITAYRTYRELA